MENSTPDLSFWGKIRKSSVDTLKPAFSVIRFLLVIMLPVSFVVLFLETSGVLYYFSVVTNPLMRFLGLPGEASLAFLSSVFMNIYSAIAVIKTITLTGKQLIVLSTMCLVAHSFFVECLVMKKTGSRLLKIVVLRLLAAVFSGWVLYHLVPEHTGKSVVAVGGLVYKPRFGIEPARFVFSLLSWFRSSIILVLQVSLIVFMVMFLQRILTEFGVMKKLAKLLAPLMRFFGLSARTGYAWVVAYTVGVAYGAGVLIDEVREGKLSKNEADLLNHHVAISHSQIEDTLLFVSIGVPYVWAALPRLILAIVTVWLEKARRAFFRHSFRVKVV
ncbi:MAG: transporter [Treponema sp.]|nr:transporter [Treponema sp.]